MGEEKGGKRGRRMRVGRGRRGEKDGVEDEGERGGGGEEG